MDEKVCGGTLLVGYPCHHQLHNSGGGKLLTRTFDVEIGSPFPSSKVGLDFQEQHQSNAPALPTKVVCSTRDQVHRQMLKIRTWHTGTAYLGNPETVAIPLK
jgi:hypothetical protein